MSLVSSMDVLFLNEVAKADTETVQGTSISTVNNY